MTEKKIDVFLRIYAEELRSVNPEWAEEALMRYVQKARDTIEEKAHTWAVGGPAWHITMARLGHRPLHIWTMKQLREVLKDGTNPNA